MSLTDRFLNAARAFFQIEEEPLTPHVFSRVRPEDMPLSSPMDTDGGRASRQEAALSLMDDDVYGYLLVAIKGDPRYGADIRADGYLERAYWPGVLMAISDLASEVEERTA